MKTMIRMAHLNDTPAGFQCLEALMEDVGNWPMA